MRLDETVIIGKNWQGVAAIRLPCSRLFKDLEQLSTSMSQPYQRLSTYDLVERYKGRR